jgi:hypothetical protein
MAYSGVIDFDTKTGSFSEVSVHELKPMLVYKTLFEPSRT